MYGLTFATYNLILGGLFTFVCDWYTLVAIVDQMLQSVHNGATKSDRNNGYLVCRYWIGYREVKGSKSRRRNRYKLNTRTLVEAGGETKAGTSNDAAPTQPPPPGTFNERGGAAAELGLVRHLNRVVATRAVLLVGWPTVCVAYLVNYFKIMRAST